jgi:hypothetical protein
VHTRARICKHLRSLGIDFKESISPVFEAWQIGTTILLFVGSALEDTKNGVRFFKRLRKARNRFQGINSWASSNVYKFWLERGKMKGEGRRVERNNRQEKTDIWKK